MRHVSRIAVVVTILVIVGCATSQEGVKSNYKTQWTQVSANPTVTTEAAKSVLEAEGLKEVKAETTNVDGKVTAKTADGTKVSVSVKKAGDTASEVSVSVGTMGDPELGAELARKIKTKAEGN